MAAIATGAAETVGYMLHWNVSLVCPANYGGPEMTGTGLFLYGMAWGVQQGILPRATYQKAMDKAWKALAASVHEDGFIGYNQGTGKDPAAGQPVLQAFKGKKVKK